MKTHLIRQRIEEALAAEEETGRLAHTILRAAKARGMHLSEAELNNLFVFTYQYIEHVPALLEQMSAVAKKQEIQTQVEPLLSAAEKYFISPSDVMPDRLGLLGLLDDAYVAHRLIQSISDLYEQQTGFSILSVDMTGVNRMIRELIGEPHASLLDAGVADELEAPEMEDSLLALLDSGKGFRMTGPDPVWGEARISDIVDSQAGAWGIA